MNLPSDPWIEKAGQIITEILPGAKIWVFGSRATGKNKPSSDLDLCVDAGQKIGLEKMAKINLALEESDIPYRVDVVDRQDVDEGFLGIIDSTAREI